MNNELNYKSNPLNGVSLKQLVTEIVEHYDYEILHAYLNLNCFKSNPSIASSVNFLKKAEWAREKVEGFYLYQYKNMPTPSYEQREIPPRDRVFPEDQVPGEPRELSLEEAEQLRAQSARKADNYRNDSANREKAKKSPNLKNNPWAKYRNK
ncbi:MAG: VF530 family DNA-binding protein [Gammaproteobacteria bacterium]|nr:VF530 family DNA-binding protein [Gammaproteobacteria bacterium]